MPCDPLLTHLLKYLCYLLTHRRITGDHSLSLPSLTHLPSPIDSFARFLWYDALALSTQYKIYLTNPSMAGFSAEHLQAMWACLRRGTARRIEVSRAALAQPDTDRTQVTELASSLAAPGIRAVNERALYIVAAQRRWHRTERASALNTCRARAAALHSRFYLPPRCMQRDRACGLGLRLVMLPEHVRASQRRIPFRRRYTFLPTNCEWHSGAGDEVSDRDVPYVRQAPGPTPCNATRADDAPADLAPP
ncbi:hypothetical protein MSAN_01558600 [Mycena sanguinolenta]|uniref:Uncharacterized protein n=1 Tax=Mycena sanguinolenta TaxID=230812 RepID=A0A8H6Y315_9AGAR|nr:hypothetical protein MSAN_01558600 [Mycena sanguinolenta]